MGEVDCEGKESREFYEEVMRFCMADKGVSCLAWWKKRWVMLCGGLVGLMLSLGVMNNEVVWGAGVRELPFEMQEVKEGRIAVFYGEGLADRKGEIEAWVKRLNEKDEAIRKEVATVRQDLGEIARKVDEMVGGREAALFVKGNAGAFMGQMIAGEGVLGLAGGEVVIGLVDRNRLFAFVKDGGEVDGITIDQKSGGGKVDLQFRAGQGMDGVVYRNVIDWTLPVERGSEGLKQRLSALDVVLMGDGGDGGEGNDAIELAGVAIHEIAEIAIIKRMDGQDQFGRWFTDGAANVITERVLGELYGKEAAARFAGVYDVRRFEGLKRETDLLRWQSKRWEAETGLPNAKALSYARYGYATEAVKGLFEVGGDDVVKHVIDGAKQMGGKGGMVTDENLLKAARAVDPDFDERMKVYVKYEGGRKGMAKGYYEELVEAQKDGRWEDAAVAMMHVMDQRNGIKAGDYARLATYMTKAGNKKGVERMLQGMRGKVSDKKTKAELAGYLVDYYLNEKRLGDANREAVLVLQVNEKHVPSLIARMLVQMNQEKYLQANVTAGKVKGLTNKGSKAYELANQTQSWVRENVGLEVAN